MLSKYEYQDILWKPNNIQPSLTGNSRQCLRITVRNKIHEHDLASRYPPFPPLNYKPFFINYRTTEQTLSQAIEATNNSKLFIFETKSISLYKQPNKPALIQLQIILFNLFSYIVLIEVYYLPRTQEPTFQLIQQLFNYSFDSNETIYVWGSIDELKHFFDFTLFSSDQIYSSSNVNLQDYFKYYWNEHHLHQSSLSLTNNLLEYIFRMCLGVKSNNPWSWHDTIALQTNQWLDKHHTRLLFKIDLDPPLIQLNSRELEYRQTMTRSATYDCLSIHHLLFSMNEIGNQQPSINSPFLSLSLILYTHIYITYIYG